MATYSSYTCGERGITNRDVEHCTSETNVTLCVSYTQIKNSLIKKKEWSKIFKALREPLTRILYSAKLSFKNEREGRLGGSVG